MVAMKVGALSYPEHSIYLTCLGSTLCRSHFLPVTAWFEERRECGQPLFCVLS